jgi:ParB-like chromosome segregation protein Spo0J
MKKTVDLQIVYRDPKELVPYVNNARTHSDEQVRQIAASIKEFGFNDPVELDGDKGIISGHGRVQAALLLGLERIPTIDLHGLTEPQKKAYILAANKLALDAGWDAELLKVELDDLKVANFDLESVGLADLEDVASVEWADDSAELTEDNYNEPDKRILECPACHHRDSSERFKKVGDE